MYDIDGLYMKKKGTKYPIHIVCLLVARSINALQIISLSLSHTPHTVMMHAHSNTSFTRLQLFILLYWLFYSKFGLNPCSCLSCIALTFESQICFWILWKTLKIHSLAEKWESKYKIKLWTVVCLLLTYFSIFNSKSFQGAWKLKISLLV